MPRIDRENWIEFQAFVDALERRIFSIHKPSIREPEHPPSKLLAELESDAIDFAEANFELWKSLRVRRSDMRAAECNGFTCNWHRVNDWPAIDTFYEVRCDEHGWNLYVEKSDPRYREWKEPAR